MKKPGPSRSGQLGATFAAANPGLVATSLGEV